jgi:hypothetical protein
MGATDLRSQLVLKKEEEGARAACDTAAACERAAVRN